MIPVLLALLAGSLIPDVRSTAASGDLKGAEQQVRAFQQREGVTPESLEALSWVAREALKAGKREEAHRVAVETQALVEKRTAAATLDREKHLPIALGAAIEVQGQALAQEGNRAEAVAFLQDQLARFRSTSIRTRIQKNLNLISLVGQKAPPLEGAALQGKPTLLFFWAHWCPDCKETASAVARVQRELPGLAVIAPTQLYGYAKEGEDASPLEESAHIQEVRRAFYSQVRFDAMPISSENFHLYGASSTPTLVLTDRNGIVRLYHPGKMRYEELEPVVRRLFARAAEGSSDRP